MSEHTHTRTRCSHMCTRLRACETRMGEVSARAFVLGEGGEGERVRAREARVSE